MLFEMVEVARGERSQRGVGLRRQRQQVSGRSVLALLRANHGARAGVEGFEEGMGVGAAEAEAADTGDAPPARHGVRSRAMRSGAAASGMCGLIVCKLCCGGISPCRIISTTLIRPAMPDAVSRWPMLVLTEPTCTAWHRRGGRQNTALQRLHLDRIAERRAGAVRFDVAEVVRREPGLAERLANALLLRGPFGAVMPAVRPSWLTAVPRSTA